MLPTTAILVWLWLICAQLAQNWGQRGQVRTAWQTSGHLSLSAPRFLPAKHCPSQNGPLLDFEDTESRLLFNQDHWINFNHCSPLLALERWWSQNFLRSHKSTQDKIEQFPDVYCTRTLPTASALPLARNSSLRGSICLVWLIDCSVVGRARRAHSRRSFPERENRFGVARLG